LNQTRKAHRRLVQPEMTQILLRPAYHSKNSRTAHSGDR
jgi:hypothetical protein